MNTVDYREAQTGLVTETLPWSPTDPSHLSRESWKDAGRGGGGVQGGAGPVRGQGRGGGRGGGRQQPPGRGSLVVGGEMVTRDSDSHQPGNLQMDRYQRLRQSTSVSKFQQHAV